MAEIDDALGAWLEASTWFPRLADVCLIWPADWVRMRRGVDPAARHRGRCKTVLGVKRLLKREGGLLAVASAGAACAGLRPTTDPKAGDVGIVQALTEWGVHPCGAIRTASRWALLSANRGLISGPFHVLAAWEV